MPKNLKAGEKVRSEHEVLNQILHFAKNDNMIRAVLLNGSRVNPTVRKDIFCDYDVVFVVSEPEYFLRNQAWIQNFGELIMMQQNNIQSAHDEWYIFLMLFEDGIRIDLSFKRLENINYEDSLTCVLLDKDNIIKVLDLPSDKSYFTNKPTKEEFEKAMNNILWCSTNVAKGLWREELPYAKYMFDVIVRNCILKMLAWYIGMNNNWCINSGMAGKWFKRYLPEEIWDIYVRTYAGAKYQDIWESLFEATKLTRRIGIEISHELGYEYPQQDDKRVMEYLERVRLLPGNVRSGFW